MYQRWPSKKLGRSHPHFFAATVLTSLCDFSICGALEKHLGLLTYFCAAGSSSVGQECNKIHKTSTSNFTVFAAVLPDSHSRYGLGHFQSSWYGMVWYGMVNVDLYSAIVTKVSNALNTLVPVSYTHLTLPTNREV